MAYSLPIIVRSGVLTSSQYTALHQWVRYHKGAPSLCDACGTTKPGRYEWANISHEYKRELDDFRRLCKSCHKRYDVPLKTTCINGHDIDASSRIRIKGNRQWRVCRRCNDIGQKRWRAKVRAARLAPTSNKRGQE